MIRMMDGVDLGFADECEPWRLESRLFPSKVGGKPAWLSLEKLPTTEELQCDTCKQQMIFLCQVYAPYEDDDSNFHRTLFVFVCSNASCCKNNQSDNIKVFRSHLRLRNKFYSERPPVEQPDPNFTLSQWVKLCNLCGCLAEKHCSKCKTAAYCCRDHQVLDWKEDHKQNCGTNNLKKVNSKKLFCEYELAIEPEIKSTHEIDEEKALEEYEQLKEEGKAGTMADVPEADLEAHSAVDEDKTFSQFRKQINDDPDQVLRYERGGNPLWIAKEPKPILIPDCEYCGGPRQFEFQIMPQMLTMLGENELDWGILIVYSCKSSCVNIDGYKKEFVFKQDVSSKKN
ncbi:hypothetical protein ILUMI_06275 [Ignelater luminosus]|uniref:MYND-type domain-containing protein n=1 Tax=Ignelater luminosus TaxID=2038154 RepID=A0A8K0GHX0_IGNLU|nr:hypothetical protein ILUMI_06275 [Ignelater luminosus]